jgi:hypothetical protein
MRRREFVALLAVAISPRLARAQHTGKHYRIALIHSGIPVEQLNETAGPYWVRRFFARRPDHLHIERFGLNEDFIERHGLTWIDNLATATGGRLDDPKHRDFPKSYVQSYLARYGVRKVEANALVVRPDAGRELCREAIFRYLPEEALPAYEAKLAAVRDDLRDEIAVRFEGGAA